MRLLRFSWKELGMVGQPDATNLGNTDWTKNATPEGLIAQGKAVFAKIGQMDGKTQERFVQELHSDPTAKRLFERAGSYTA